MRNTKKYYVLTLKDASFLSMVADFRGLALYPERLEYNDLRKHIIAVAKRLHLRRATKIALLIWEIAKLKGKLPKIRPFEARAQGSAKRFYEATENNARNQKIFDAQPLIRDLSADISYRN